MENVASRSGSSNMNDFNTGGGNSNVDNLATAGVCSSNVGKFDTGGANSNVDTIPTAGGSTNKQNSATSGGSY